MRVIAYDPYPSEIAAGVTMCNLKTVMTEADVVSLHCPLTADNRKMINGETLGFMRDGAILINTARGGLVDEQALLQALQSGKLRAVGLDTFATEPFSLSHPFSGIPNVILTPHIGGVTSDAYVSMGTAAARNILETLREPVLSQQGEN